MIFSTAYTISIMTLTADKKAQLRSFYYDVLRGGKLEKTWKRVQREFPGEYSRKQVKEFIDNQASAQETKPYKRDVKKFTSIHAKKPGGIFQIDLMFFTGGNVGPQRYAGVLNVVDVYSRYAWSELIKADPKPKNHKAGTPWRMAAAGGKGRKSVLNAFKKILQRSGGRKPQNVNMDEGNEFTNDSFKSYLQEIGATLHYSNKYTFMKNPIVERFNRTLRDAMREFEATGKTQFEAVQALQGIMKNYNRDVHSTTKERPIDIWRGKETNKQKRNNPTFNFKEGDEVRLLETKGLFAKSGAKGWSKEVYRIYDVKQKSPASASKVMRYLLEINGDPLSFIDKKDKAEKPAWFMGYQLLAAGKSERPEGYSSDKAKQANATKAGKKQKAKQRRALAKEGLDDAGPVTRQKRRKRQPKAPTAPTAAKVAKKAKKAKKAGNLKVGQGIRVKWNMEGGGFQWYEGRIVGYDAARQHHLVVYEGEDSTPYAINLTQSKQPEFVRKKNWKLT